MGKTSLYGGTGKEYICPQCGKTFRIPFQTRGGGKTQWAYYGYEGKHKKYMCSYSCVLANEREREVV